MTKAELERLMQLQRAIQGKLTPAELLEVNRREREVGAKYSAIPKIAGTQGKLTPD